MKKLFKSLRSRLILCILAVGILPVSALHFLVVSTYENTLIRRRSIDIQQRFRLIASELSSAEKVSDSLTADTVKTLNWYSEAYGGRLLVIDSDFQILLDTFNADDGKVCISDVVFSALSGNEYYHYKKESGFLEFVLPVIYTSGEEKSITGAIVFSAETGWIDECLEAVRKGMYLVEGILGVSLILLAIYISFLIVRPLQTVSDELNAIDDGNIDGDISVIRSYSEVDDILETTSRIIGRYQEMEHSQEEFVSNVSHELRTPITSIRVLSDSLLGQEGIPEDVYQEFMCDISTEIDRQGRIIEDLLSMSRLGKTTDSMNIAPAGINEFVLNLLKSIKPIAASKNIELIYETYRQVTADIDEVKLNQAFSNLVENAVKYNSEGGTVRVSLDADHEYFYLKVEDNGIGIPEDALSHIFDRFYRVDKARSRDTGGTGLGLSITKAIILQHYGVIKVDSVVNEGTVFTVRIPLKHVKKEAKK